MKKTFLYLVVSLLAISLCGCMGNVEASDKSDVIADIKGLVEEFGSRLQLVSLLAPKDVVSQSLEENYGNLVTEDLLLKWKDSPENAPGRLVSSPWPDRIEVLGVKELTEDSYEVEAQIIEITSVEKENGGIAARRLLTLSVKKVDNRWIISDVVLGEYEELIAYRNDDYGFCFVLPKSWDGYYIVSEEWEGRAIHGSQAGEIIERGPILSIRHPEWTEENVRQDIPIMIFSISQWESLQKTEFSVGAAPVGPTELARNDDYVFALPARYNYAFPEGYEEVEEILQANSLQIIGLAD